MGTGERGQRLRKIGQGSIKLCFNLFRHCARLYHKKKHTDMNIPFTGTKLDNKASRRVVQFVHMHALVYRWLNNKRDTVEQLCH